MSIANIPHALSAGGGTMFRNVITNGGFTVNQRQTPSTMTAMCTTALTSPTQSPYFVADRWIAWRTVLVANGQMALMSLGNGDLPFTSAGLTNFARIGRASGDTSVANINLLTNLESLNSIPLAAKTVTLSFYCRAGVNYSGSTNAASSLGLGVLVDQNYAMNSLGAGASVLTNTFTPTTTWQRFSYAYNIPATTTQVAPILSYTPLGTAGASDYIDVTGVQLEISTSPTLFESRPFAFELSLCQRYYELIGNFGIVAYTNGTVSMIVVLNFKTNKRASPSVAMINTLSFTQPTFANLAWPVSSTTLTNQFMNLTGCSLNLTNTSITLNMSYAVAPAFNGSNYVNVFSVSDEL